MPKIASMLTWADKLLIIVLFSTSLSAIAYSVFAFPITNDQATEIWVDGKLVKTVPLKAGYRQELRLGDEIGYDIIEVDGTRIRVREADCPEQICVKTGWISKAPQQIVCLPYHIVIKVISDTPPEVDSITG